VLVYILFFVFISILAIQYEFTPFKNDILLFSVALLLALLAGFRGIDVARDYYNYQYFFDNLYKITGEHNFSYLLIFEPGYVAIVYFFRSAFVLNYGLAIMLFYALTTMLTKTVVINRLSINPYLTLLFYYSYFFLLHEMAQIRISLASAIFLIALVSFLNGKRKSFVLLILVATLFHYSAILYLGILLFNVKDFNKKLYTGILIMAILFGFIHLPLLSALDTFTSSSSLGKLNNYVVESQNGISINVFNYLNLCNIACCAYLMFLLKKNTINNDKKLILFLKCNILSIFLLSFFASAPALDLRVSQLFGIVQIFLFTYLARYLPVKKFNIFIAILIAASFFYVTGFYGQVLHPYKLLNIR
jgi:hypothetical protein